MSYMLSHLHNGWQVDQAILSEEDRVVVIRFGHDWDPTCMKMDEVLYSIAEKVKNFCVIYLVDITEVPDFNKMYELYDPCTCMFFFRNKHIMIDLGTGNNNKINWALEDKQEMVDIVETIFQTDKLIPTLIHLNCTKLVTALKEVGLDKLLSEYANNEVTVDDTPSATIFAPTDSAFDQFEKLGVSGVDLLELLSGHAVDHNLNSSQAVAQKVVPTLAAGVSVFVSNYTIGGKPLYAVNGAKIATPDYMTTNGIIHVIDRVIYPLAKYDSETTLHAAAPVTDGFFQPENRMMLNLLKNPGFTLFAPSNEAWSRVPFNILANLTDAQFGVLGLRHLVGPESAGLHGPLFSPALLASSPINLVSVSNKNLTVKLESGVIKVNGASVISSDYATINRGVIHVIDSVLLEGLP
ncbi:unnamed protein product [Notodromas monacha]|uniref:Thioredoxin-like protein 4A n=2 Tax=Pancrustacea TaxID=197562 RepID=A0A7R9BUY4_9CRUS|nr:unnamed protein product [Notodromas monacha]CAG0920693.1 unnamed protein product [Notodromas monacha]